MNKPLGIALWLLTFCTTGTAHDARIPPLAVSDRGELMLNEQGEIHYQPWQFQALSAPARVGLFMLMPARPSSRKQIAPLEEALEQRAFTYTRLASSSVINLGDATWGAGLLVERELKASKQKNPRVQLVVDESDAVRAALNLPRGLAHVLLHDCEGSILLSHSGAVSAAQATDIIERIDRALAGESCGSSAS